MNSLPIPAYLKDKVQTLNWHADSRQLVATFVLPVTIEATGHPDEEANARSAFDKKFNIDLRALYGTRAFGAIKDVERISPAPDDNIQVAVTMELNHTWTNRLVQGDYFVLSRLLEETYFSIPTGPAQRAANAELKHRKAPEGLGEHAARIAEGMLHSLDGWTSRR